LVLPDTNSTSERSFSALKRIKTYLRAVRTYERGNKLYILPEPGSCLAREDRNTHAKFFCNQAQNYQRKPAASTTIYLFLNHSMIAVFLYNMNTILTSYTSFDEGTTSWRGQYRFSYHLVKFISEALGTTMT